MAANSLSARERQQVQQAYSALPGEAGDNPFSANLRYALAALRRHLWMAAGIVGFAVAAAVIITLLDTPRFTATTSVQINDQSEKVLGDELDGGTTETSDWDTDRFLNTQLDILRSRALALRVSRSLDLDGNAAFLGAMEVSGQSEGMDGRARQEQVLDLLRSNMNVNLPRSTRIAAIGFTSTDPQMSARIANSFAEEFIQSNLQRRFDSTAYARNFVAEQLEEARSRLESSERELNDYARQAGLIRTRNSTSEDSTSSGSGSITASSLMQLSDAANQAQAARVQAETRWAAEQAVPLFSSQVVLANPTVQSLMTKRAEVQGNLQTARERYLPDHPTVTRLQADLASTEAQLNRTAGNVRNSIRADLVAARAAEKQLQAQVKRLEGATLAEQDKSVRYNTLAREADTNRSIYDGLLQRYRELNASAGVATSNLSIIDKADPPLVPSSPDLLRNLAVALLLGLGLAGAAVFLRDQLDDVVRVPEDVEGKLGLPLLGVIPRSQMDSPAQELEDAKSPMTEAYNSLRGSLLYSTQDGLPKIIAVTSAQPTEGKSTTSLALAQAFGKLGMRAVLIDADLRRPSLHTSAGVANQRGLSDLLTGQALAADISVQVASGPFDLIPSGPLPPGPAELVASPRMAQLLEELSAAYDVVIIDSPPVLGLADAPMIAALADGTMFVVEAGRARSAQVKAALRRLRGTDPVLLGALLTKFDPEQAGNRYSAYYGREYYRYADGARG